MAVYSKSDFDSANAALLTLERDIADANNLITTIKSFQGNSKTNLKGKSWDLVRTSLDNYIQVLNTRISNCKSLYSGIKSANNIMIAALNGNDKIDTSKLEELKVSYNRCATLVNSSDDTITESERQKNLALLQDLKGLIEQIERVQQAEQLATSNLSNLLESTNSYQAQVDGIIPSSIIYSEQI